MTNVIKYVKNLQSINQLLNVANLQLFRVYTNSRMRSQVCKQRKKMPLTITLQRQMLKLRKTKLWKMQRRILILRLTIILPKILLIKRKSQVTMKQFKPITMDILEDSSRKSLLERVKMQQLTVSGLVMAMTHSALVTV